MRSTGIGSTSIPGQVERLLLDAARFVQPARAVADGIDWQAVAVGEDPADPDDVIVNDAIHWGVLWALPAAMGVMSIVLRIWARRQGW